MLLPSLHAESIRTEILFPWLPRGLFLVKLSGAGERISVVTSLSATTHHNGLPSSSRTICAANQEDASFSWLLLARHERHPRQSLCTAPLNALLPQKGSPQSGQAL